MTSYPRHILDLYLYPPTGPGLEDFIPSIQTALSLLSPEEILSFFGSEIQIEEMLSKYGRFWLSGPNLFYRHPNGRDILIKKIRISPTPVQDHLLFKVNDFLIPLVSAEQLKLLLQKFGTTSTHKKICQEINRYHGRISESIETSKIH